MASEDEKEVGEAVEVAEKDGVDAGLVRKCYYTAFCTPTDGACHVALGSLKQTNKRIAHILGLVACQIVVELVW